MPRIEIGSFSEWRKAARDLLRRRVPPEEAEWAGPGDSQETLFTTGPAAGLRGPAVLIPRSFLSLAESAARHSDPKRWSLLYRVAWRIAQGERNLLEVDIDPDVAVLNAMRRAVEKDIYRMRAYVRFRKVEDEAGERFVAWYRPEHRTLEANGPFFVNRFGSMRWAILTPDTSLVWDLKKLETGPGVPRSRAPEEDELEDLWRLYYGTVFNPARLNLTAMRAQLPVGRWVDLPEARLIPELARASRGRVHEMIAAAPPSASDFVVPGSPLPVLHDAVRQCNACGICSRATGPVFGEGNPQARIMLVGEQPGDEEDRAGHPFVGPAGRLLDTALEKAGLDRPDLYLTNAVKAFRFEERGKRRIHQNPRSNEIGACRPWLMAEIQAVRPQAIVCLGASAAQSVLGRKPSIGAERGRLLPHPAGQVAVTYHPSAVLRSPDPETADRVYASLVEDLDSVRRFVASNSWMKFFAALLLPLVASAAILPEAIGPYKRTDTSQPALTDTPIWDEFGLKSSEIGAFEGEKVKFSVTAYRLQDPTGALGAFQWQRPQNSTTNKLSAETKTGLLTAFGNYLLRFDGYKPAPEELTALQNALLNVDNSSLPVLPSYLPANGLVANSERYATGPAALQKFFPAVPPSVAGFNYGTEAQLGVFHNAKGDFTLGIFNYPTHQIAMQQATQFEKLQGAVVKRSGPMIAVVVSPPDPDFAQHVLSQIRYQAEVTQSEYVPTQRDNPGNLLYNAFLLTGILLALAVLSGLFFGAIRSARRVTRKGVEQDPVITLHLEQ
jgi:DNA polymerase